MRRAGILLLCLIALRAGAESDALLEQRVTALSEQLRCLVCQNQTIADSHAELAIDLRKQVREQLASGRSESEVAQYMVQRYGDFVLYKPPVKRQTWLLWFGPFVLLGAGVLVLLRRLRQARGAADEVELSAAQREQAAQLLKTDAAKDES